MLMLLTAGNSLAQASSIFASNYPLAYFAQQISGQEHIVTMPEGVTDPASWQPSPAEISAIQEANLILLNGASYEKWLNQVSLAKRKVLNTSLSFSQQYIPSKPKTKHIHGPTGKHVHSEYMFTTWIDFSQAAMQAQAVKNGLLRLGFLEQNVNANYQKLNSNLIDLDTQLLQMTHGFEQKPLLGAQPVYDYLARRYALNLKTVDWEADVIPSNLQWQMLENLIQQHPARWMVWATQPLPEVARRLQTLGISSVVFDPLANKPISRDFMSLMQKNINNLEAVFKE